MFENIPLKNLNTAAEITAAQLQLQIGLFDFVLRKKQKCVSFCRILECIKPNQIQRVKLVEQKLIGTNYQPTNFHSDKSGSPPKSGSPLKSGLPQSQNGTSPQNPRRVPSACLLPLLEDQGHSRHITCHQGQDLRGLPHQHRLEQSSGTDWHL